MLFSNQSNLLCIFITTFTSQHYFLQNYAQQILGLFKCIANNDPTRNLYNLESITYESYFFT